MKIRLDFVTNSSSSSFILAFNSKQEALDTITQKLSYYPEVLGIVTQDVMRATGLTAEELQNVLENYASSYAYHQMHFGEGDWWSSSEDTWEKRFTERHPDLTYSEMLHHPEYIAEQKRLMNEYIAKDKARIADKSFVIELEYSDNDGKPYAELEHYIMPHINGLIDSMNCH